jgi:hypothetical protein
MIRLALIVKAAKTTNAESLPMDWEIRHRINNRILKKLGTWIQSGKIKAYCALGATGLVLI